MLNPMAVLKVVICVIMAQIKPSWEKNDSGTVDVAQEQSACLVCVFPSSMKQTGKQNTSNNDNGEI